MTLYHFSNSTFDQFDASFLGSYTEDRTCPDEMEAVSSFGFCFVEEDAIDALTECYGDDFGAHLAECEFDGSENFDSTYDDFTAWIARDGIEAVRAQLEEDGIEFLNLWNGNFNEIIVLDSSLVRINEWIR